MSALSGSGASRSAHACIPEDKHVFCRSLLDLHHKHEWHALVLFVDLSIFDCDAYKCVTPTGYEGISGNERGGNTDSGGQSTC